MLDVAVIEQKNEIKLKDSGSNEKSRLKRALVKQSSTKMRKQISLQTAYNGSLIRWWKKNSQTQ